MYKAIFWDVDGLLIDTEPIYYQTAKEVLATIGIEFTEKYYKENILTGKVYSLFDLAEKRGYSKDEIAGFRKIRDEKFEKIVMSKDIVIDGVRETLDTLRKEKLMIAVTLSFPFNFEVSMRSSKLNSVFDHVITQKDVKRGKPSPDCYLLALEKSGYKANECVVFEDAERGVIAAKDAGLDCYAIPSKWTKDLDFSMADGILKSIKEVSDIVF